MDVLGRFQLDEGSRNLYHSSLTRRRVESTMRGELKAGARARRSAEKGQRYAEKGRRDAVAHANAEKQARSDAEARANTEKQGRRDAEAHAKEQ